MRDFDKALAVLAAVASAGISTSAFAQDTGTTVDQPKPDSDDASGTDIIVTAQRRDQKLSDVGISVSVASGDQLRTLNVSNSADLAKFTPGVFLSGVIGGQSAQYTVRAVNQSDYTDVLEAPIAVYLDDVYIPVQQGQTMALFDIDRVEILKGPQGTLFGRNATGGLVHTVITQADASGTSGYLNLGYGRFNDVKLEGALNLPLSSGSALRVSGFWHRRDNFWQNLYPAGLPSSVALNFGSPGVGPAKPGGDSGALDDLGGRVQLKFEPTDALTIRLAVTGARSRMPVPPSDINPTASVEDSQGRVVDFVRIGPNETRTAIAPNGGLGSIPFLALFSPSAGGTRPVPGGNWYGFRPPNADDLVFSQDFMRTNRTDSINTSLHIDYDLGGAQLTAISGYQHYYKNLMNEVDGTPVNIVAYGSVAKFDTFTQELRLSGSSPALNWQVGGFYMNNRAWNVADLKAPKGALLAYVFGGTALANTGADFDTETLLKTDSFSAFGQVEWRFAPQLTLVAGGRVIFDHQDYRYATYVARNDDDYDISYATRLPGFGFLEDNYADRRWQTLWAGKLQLEYRPVDGLMLYAGINRGTKSGAYNAKLPDGSPAYPHNAIPYRAEVLYNYEAGVKYAGRTFSVNAAGYYYDYKSYQAFSYTNLNGIVTSTPATIYGIDVDATWRVTPDLRLTVGGTILKSRINDYTIAPGVMRDVEFTYAPSETFTASLNYTLPVDVAGGRVSFNAQASYASDYYVVIRNFESTHFPSRWLADFNLGWRNTDTGLSVSLYLKNAFDQKYNVVSYDNTGVSGNNQNAIADPRTYGVSVGIKF